MGNRSILGSVINLPPKIYVFNSYLTTQVKIIVIGSQLKLILISQSLLMKE